MTESLTDVGSHGSTSTRSECSLRSFRHQCLRYLERSHVLWSESACNLANALPLWPMVLHRSCSKLLRHTASDIIIQSACLHLLCFRFALPSLMKTLFFTNLEHLSMPHLPPGALCTSGQKAGRLMASRQASTCAWGCPVEQGTAQKTLVFPFAALQF